MSLKKEIPVLILFSENGCIEVKNQLEKVGFKSVFINRDFINGLCLHKYSLKVEDKSYKFDVSVCHSSSSKDEKIGCNLFLEVVKNK